MCRYVLPLALFFYFFGEVKGMANEKNLIPNEKRTPSERRENAKKAGIASGIKRKEQATYREMAKTMLSAKIQDKKALKNLKAFGIEDDTVKALTLLGLIKASAGGSHNAFDRLLILAGESGAEETNSEKKQREFLAAIEKAVKDGN